MYIFWLVVLLPCAVAAPLTTLHESSLIEGKYIVKFRAGISLTSVDEMKSRISNSPDFTYSFGNFAGLAGTLTDKEVDMVKQMDSVEYVQQNAAVHTQDWLVQENAPWGLGRISHVEKGNTSYVFDSSSGEGTCAYIIDTGIFVDHPDFEGRAEWLENLSGDGEDSDGNGHGTHVAGIIGASTYGVAKKTKLFAVKVLDAYGSGTIAGVIAGVNFVVNDAKTRDCPKGVVVNMSLGGGKNPATNDAVASAIKSGLFISVAAGNSNSDAAGFSPASEPTACTVGSVDVADTKSTSSNFGPLVDVYAPGVQIKSTWNDGSTNTISGTSMAAPHIAGLGAYLLALEKDTSTRTLCERIVELANEGKISGLPSGTANRLAFNGAPSIYN